MALQSKRAGHCVDGPQCNIRTDGSFNRARIQSIDTARIEEELHKGRVVIVAGFQGVTDNDEVTTLGRGGGDITGAAVAAALNASVCEICTDVDGVLSADPNIVPEAKFWPELTYEEAIEMASSGAKVLHPRAAEICHSYKIPIHVRSSFHLREGTWIREGEKTMEQASVVAVTSDKKIAKVTLLNVPDRPGVAGRRFSRMWRQKELNIGLIIRVRPPITARASHSSFRKISRTSRRNWWLTGKSKGLPQTGWWRRRGHDLDHWLRLAATARHGRTDVCRTGPPGHQRRLHQLLGDDAVMRDCGGSGDAGRPGCPYRSSSPTRLQRCRRSGRHHRTRRSTKITKEED